MEKFLICITLCFLFIGCNEKDIELSKVDAFVNVLKEDSNERIETPDFTSDDIADFLKYRNDQQYISNFPRNPLSSFYMEEVTIGMYVLWNIESVRLKSIDSPDFYLFASLNPRIIRVSSGELIDQDDILPEVASAYLKWWNSGLVLEEKLQINPLEKLDLSWN